jgi:hypothetical protein
MVWKDRLFLALALSVSYMESRRTTPAVAPRETLSLEYPTKVTSGWSCDPCSGRFRAPDRAIGICFEGPPSQNSKTSPAMPAPSSEGTIGTDSRDGISPYMFRPPPGGRVWSQVYLNDCALAHPIRVEEINDRHEVILHAGTKLLGITRPPVQRDAA